MPQSRRAVFAVDTPSGPPRSRSRWLVFFLGGRGISRIWNKRARVFFLQFNGYGISSVWVRLGWREKRTDLAWHIDFVFFCIFFPRVPPFSVFLDGSVSSRGRASSTTAMTLFPFPPCFHYLYTTWSERRSFFLPFRPRRVLGWIQVRRRYPLVFRQDVLYTTNQTRGGFAALRSTLTLRAFDIWVQQHAR